MNTKICSKCGEEKDIEEFRKYFEKRCDKYYYRPECKKCARECAAEYCHNHPDKIKECQKKMAQS